jgi:hypothetical protein
MYKVSVAFAYDGMDLDDFVERLETVRDLSPDYANVLVEPAFDDDLGPMVSLSWWDSLDFDAQDEVDEDDEDSFEDEDADVEFCERCGDFV